MKTIQIIIAAVFVLAACFTKASADQLSPDQLRICAEIKKGNSADYPEVQIDQTLRSIKLINGDEVQGKIIKYVGITVHIQKPDGSILTMPGTILSNDEILSVFPNTMLGGVVKNSKIINNLQSPGNALDKLKEAVSQAEAKDQVIESTFDLLKLENEKLKAENDALSAKVEAGGGKELVDLRRENARFEVQIRVLNKELARLGQEASAQKATTTDPFAVAAPIGPDPFTATAAAPDIPKKWVEIARFSGSGDTNTAAFPLSGTGEWRVRWIAGDSLYLTIRDPRNRSLVESFSSKGATTVGQGMVFTKHPRCYIEVGAIGKQAWQVLVEEHR